MNKYYDYKTIHLNYFSRHIEKPYLQLHQLDLHHLLRLTLNPTISCHSLVHFIDRTFVKFFNQIFLIWKIDRYTLTRNLGYSIWLVWTNSFVFLKKDFVIILCSRVPCRNRPFGKTHGIILLINKKGPCMCRLLRRKRYAKLAWPFVRFIANMVSYVWYFLL